MPFLFLSLVLAGALSSEQAPQAGTQRGAPQAARISGRVVEDGTNAPLSGANVTVIPMDRPPAASFPPVTPQTMTDADGRYVFDGLAPGRYRIGARKTGFASPFAPDPGAFRTFELAAGQALAGVNISLQKAAVITGQVLDPSSGEPLVGSMVAAMRRLGAIGGPAAVAPSNTTRLMPAGQSAYTNDLGEFRIFGLPPGEYFVVAGGSPNSGFATSPPSPGGAATAASPPTRVVMTFYPGTADASAAEPVRLAAGQVATGIVIRLVTAQTYQVSGTVVDENGLPVAGAMVMLRADPRSGFGAMPAGDGRSDASGAFVIGGVTPGSYMATASVPVRTSPSSGGVSASVIALSPLNRSNQLDVAVTDANIEGLQVVVQRPQ